MHAQINNAGTNKGFRPLLQFSDEDIKQVCSFLYLYFLWNLMSFYITVLVTFYNGGYSFLFGYD